MYDVAAELPTKHWRQGGLKLLRSSGDLANFSIRGDCHPLYLTSIVPTLMAVTPIAQNFIVELLSAIFLGCLPEDGVTRVRRKQVPLNVSHVCRHWRYVSLSTRRLWTSLSLLCASNSEFVFEHALPTLQAFLQRSGSADFHFKINCALNGVHFVYLAPNTSFAWPSTEVLFRELERESERIKGLTLTVPQALDALEFAIHTLPALDHLSLQLFNDMPFHRPILYKAFWTVVSRLKSLEFNCAVYFEYNPGDIQISTLKYLAFHSCSTRTLLQILSCCPALESLYFNPAGCSDFISSVAVIDEERQFPSIKFLEVANHDGPGPYLLRLFFTLARLPNLRRLIMRSSDRLEPNLEPFIAASHNPLEELCLINNEPLYDEGPLVRILKLLPDLKKLRIRLHQAVVRALVLFDAGDKGICPSLEEVTFDIKDMTFEESVQTWTATEDMIRSRWEMPKDRLSMASKSRTSISTHNVVAPGHTRNLRRINLPDIKEEHWKRHQLYRCIKDCQRQGLVVSFRDDWP